MRVDAVLQAKGSFVATVGDDARLHDVARLLWEHGIGALVVTGGERRLTGIVSERDITRAVATRGVEALDLPVTDVMTAEVRTCRPDDSVDLLMAIMTNERVRHLPVVDDAGALAGIVSIGDVVKHRLGELQAENGALHEYLYSGR